MVYIISLRALRFLSTPSGWRATKRGDAKELPNVFLSTPSGWRATGFLNFRFAAALKISIHALRVEGDACTINAKCPGDDISIHALRVEGDPETARQGRPRNYFYPRPPGGGRHRAAKSLPLSARFLSTPSGWRATSSRHATIRTRTISIHALRVEGDGADSGHQCGTVHFYPRPPGGGRLVPIEPLHIFEVAISIHALRVEGDSSRFNK